MTKLNKRQRKKQFKKQYGYNPDKVLTAINSMSDMVQALVDGFANMFKTMFDFMKELPQKIKEMPEDEFQSILNSPELGEKNKQLLIKLRHGEGDETD